MDKQQKITVYGHLGKKPELRQTKRATPFCTFTIAEHAQDAEAPRWHNIVMWDKDSKHWAKVLDKGSPVFVQGHMVEKEFKNELGEVKKYREINADAIGFVTLNN